MMSSDPTTKLCSVCDQHKAPIAYSGAQLKKKGQRVCRACVDSQQWRAVTPATGSTCQVCVYQGSTKPTTTRACPNCASRCCSQVCFDKHKESRRCEYMQHPPPLTIALEDMITQNEILAHLQRLRHVAEHQLLNLPATMKEDAPDEFPSVSFDDVVVIATVYPPADALWPWWAQDAVSAGVLAGVPSQMAQTEQLQLLVCAFAEVVGVFSCLYSYVMVRYDLLQQTPDERRAFNLSGIKREKMAVVPCPFEDASRVFHRILTYLIYYFRHVDLQLIPECLRPLIDVQDDARGVLPYAIVGDRWWGVAYCTAKDAQGRDTLVPMAIEAHLLGTSMVRSRLERETCAMMIIDGRLHTGQGLCVMRNSSFSNVFALAATLRSAATYLSMPSDELVQEAVEDGVSESRLKFALVRTIRDALHEEWPALDQATFISLPVLGLEEEVVELLLLEALRDQAADKNDDSKDNSSDQNRARQLIALVEQDIGVSIEEVIEAQKTRLEQMLDDQHAQLAIHAEVVARAEQRRLNAPRPPGAPAIERAESNNHHPTASSLPISNGALDALLSAGRLKFRRVKKLLLSVLHSSSLQVDRVAHKGSHVVTHLAGASPWTLVEKHSGRSKDSVVTRSVRTRICAHLLSVVQSHM
jgi:hypothetical protein